MHALDLKLYKNFFMDFFERKKTFIYDDEIIVLH
jgi:hypothetical protein